MNIIPPKQSNGGYGGTYLWGKEDVAVHIIQTADTTIHGGKDGSYSELFLFHEQTSLVGEKMVLIGTSPKNFTSVPATNNAYSAAPVNKVNGSKGGVSHAPDTANGSGLGFFEGTMRVAFKSGFSIVGGGKLVEEMNSGYYSTAPDQFFSFGADKTHSELTHVNVVAIS